MKIRPYQKKDLHEMRQIWNEIVEEGNAFPQDEPLSLQQAEAFFGNQSWCGVAEEENGKLAGLYILHPNNVGRCGHICNASYAIKAECRGQGTGRLLVQDCLQQAKGLGFSILQFNAVAADNLAARKLYESLGFVQLGTIPNGFRCKDGSMKDICPYYRAL